VEFARINTTLRLLGIQVSGCGLNILCCYIRFWSHSAYIQTSNVIV